MTLRRAHAAPSRCIRSRPTPSIATDEFAIDPAEPPAAAGRNIGPGLAVAVLAIALDVDDPAVLDRADDILPLVANIERRASRVRHLAAVAGERGRGPGERGGQRGQSQARAHR